MKSKATLPSSRRERKPKKPRSGPRVFVSYSPVDADRRWLRRFVASLQDQGATVWFDEWNIPAGDPLREPVEAGLRNSDVIASIITPDHVARPNLFFEIGAALAMGKRFVAIVPRDVEPSILPEPLRTRRFLIQDSPEETARELLASAGEPVVVRS